MCGACCRSKRRGKRKYEQKRRGLSASAICAWETIGSRIGQASRESVGKLPGGLHGARIEASRGPALSPDARPLVFDPETSQLLNCSWKRRSGSTGLSARPSIISGLYTHTMPTLTVRRQRHRSNLVRCTLRSTLPVILLLKKLLLPPHLVPCPMPPAQSLQLSHQRLAARCPVRTCTPGIHASVRWCLAVVQSLLFFLALALVDQPGR